MGRKSSIHKLSNDQRTYIERLLREDRYTLDDMLVKIKTKFGDAPSRSALGRYSQSFDEMASRMKEIQAASRVLVAELGEDVDDKLGGLLVQAVTTVATHAAMNASSQDEVDIKEIGQLARAARDVMSARKMSVDEREELKRIAQEELLTEQKAKLDELGKTDGINKDALATVAKELYGLTL